MKKVFKRFFKGEGIEINPLCKILGKGVYAFQFSLGGNNTLSTFICECISDTESTLEYMGDKLTLIDSTDFNGLPNRHLRFKDVNGKMVRLFFPAMDGQNKTCIITMDKVNYPALIKML